MPGELPQDGNHQSALGAASRRLDLDERGQIDDAKSVFTKAGHVRVLEQLDITEEELGLLADLGLAHSRKGNDGDYYDDADLDIIEIINETREKGMGDLFPMSILEPYVACIRTLVRLELSLFQERVLGGAKLPELPLPEVAKNATQLGERLVVAMRTKLVFPELQGMAAGKDSDDS